MQRGTADAGDSGRADACMGLVARAYKQSGQKNGVSSGERAWSGSRAWSGRSRNGSGAVSGGYRN